MKKEKNLYLALLTSFAVCLLFSLIFGVVYYLGYISIWIGLVAAIAASLAYTKFYKANWLMALWILIWIIALNEFAMITAISISLSSELGISLSSGFSLLFEFLKSSNDVKDAFVLDSILNSVFAFIGTAYMFIDFLIKEKRAKGKNQFGIKKLENTTSNKTEISDKKEEAPEIENESTPNVSNDEKK